MRKDLRQLFDDFIDEATFIKKLSPETVRGYINTYRTLIKLVPDVSVETLNTSILTMFFKILHERKRVVGKELIKSGIKKSTAASYWCKLNAYFKWLVSKGHIKANPFEGIQYTGPSYEDKKYLAKHEVEKILAAIYTEQQGNILLFKRNVAIFNILLFCGLRKEELLLLQIRDIDLERKLLTIRGETSKTRITRQLPLHSSTIMHLKDYLNERRRYSTPYLIVSSNRDNRLTADGLKHLVTKFNKSSKVHFHLHQFRHTFAVNFLRSTNNILKLKLLLGHKNINVTMLYLRCLAPHELHGDIESMRIDTFL